MSVIAPVDLSSYVTTGNLTGKTFDDLLVISFVGTTPHSTWKCRCRCGNERVVRATRLVNGRVSSCAACSKAMAAAKGAKTRSLASSEAILRKVEGTYRNNAKAKSLEFSLTRAEFRALVQSDCRYCGTKPSRLAGTRSRNDLVPYNGIDRLDSRRGYVPDNVVPSCTECNFAKHQMSEQNFISWVRRVAAHISKSDFGADGDSL